MTDPDPELAAAVQRAVATLTLGISDALGPVRPVAGVARGPRRSSRVLLRAMERAYADLKAVDAQRAYDAMGEHQPAEPEPEPDPVEYHDQTTASVRAIPAGLPTLGRGRR